MKGTLPSRPTEAAAVETADQVAVLDLVAVMSGETEAAVVEGTVEAELMEVAAMGAVAMVVAAAATVVLKV